MNVLIVYGTTHGQTAKVAVAIAAVAEALGHTAKTETGAVAPSPEDFDAVFLGGSIHFGAFQENIQTYVAANGAALSACRTSLFCVSGSARDESGMEEARTFPDALLKETAWTPDHIQHIAGAFPFSEYPLWKRWLMRFFLWKQDKTLDTSHDLEFTDWPAVDVYAREFLNASGTENGVTHT